MAQRYDSTNLLSGSCVSDVTFDVVGKPFTLQLSRVCPHLEMIRLLLMGFGAVLWLVIVFRG
ncbi:virulence factor TspB C-terminal domain-related protein [Paracidovorax anthurii]|nr:virulence factor TspB C-terminal domain-related protein [Paracidovorax anthurii]